MDFTTILNVAPFFTKLTTAKESISTRSE